MSFVGSNILAGASGQGGGGYAIERSLRFNSADDSRLDNSMSTAGNRSKYTFSFWVKFAGYDYAILSCGTNSSGFFEFKFNGDSQLELHGENITGTKTVSVFRDYSAWYHIMLVIDKANSTASDRAIIYVNGTRQTLTTTDQGNTGGIYWGHSAQPHRIGGRTWGGGNEANYYLAEFYHLDNIAATPSAFGETDNNGVWQPIEYDGTYGTIGFHLDFKDNSSKAALGTDTSGNSNTWTVSNLSPGVSLISLASATGALPILNTTDTYGQTLGSGARSDSLASSLQICIPGGTSGGLNLSDQNPSGRTSSPRNMTGSSLVNDTSTSPYYGGSLSVPHNVTGTYSNDVWTSIGSGAFTVEMWVYLVDSSMSDGYGYNVFCGRTSYDGIVQIGSTWGGHTGNVAALKMNCRPSSGSYTDHWITDSGAKGAFPVGEWVHCAQTRDSSGTVRTFKNGVKVAESTGITGSLSINHPEFGGWTSGYADPTEFKVCDIRVYTAAKYTSDFIPPKTTISTAEATGNDSLRDSPSQIANPSDTGAGGEVVGNYATFNALLGSGTKSNGNLLTTTSGYSPDITTIAPSSGKWYVEITWDSGSYARIGIQNPSVTSSDFGEDIYGWRYESNTGNFYNGSNGTLSSHATYGTGTVVGIALDCDAGKVWISKNGVYANSGNPASGANPAATNVPIGTPIAFACTTGSSASVFTLNAGQRAFSSAAPAGYKSLNTANLPEPTIADGSLYFDVNTWDGNSTSRDIATTLSPDFVWIKGRSHATNHVVYDVIRGATQVMYADTTSASRSQSTQLTAFNSNSFSLAAGNEVNLSGRTYVGYAWDAGSSTTTIAAGGLNSSSYDQSATWSNSFTSDNGFMSGYGATQAFNGTTSGNHSGSNGGGTLTFAPNLTIPANSIIEGYFGSGSTTYMDVTINGVANNSTPGGAWVKVNYNGSTTLTSLTIYRTGGGNSADLRGLKINGKLLVDNGVSVPNVPTIASQVRANPSAGFSIVKWTGNRSAATVGHGLNAAVKFYIVKNLDQSSDWLSWHTGLPGGGTGYIRLNTTGAPGTASSPWNSTVPTNSVFSLGVDSESNGNGDDMIAYCFSPVEGYSSMGVFTGNGSAEGPFVYTGMRPRWLLIKLTSGTSNWRLFDTERDPYNAADTLIFPDSSEVEYTAASYNTDFLSNGFKMRNTHAGLNGSGSTYLYFAFASNPFKTARAR